MQTSRSVIIPTTLPFWSSTGRDPQSDSHISLAARSSGSLIQQVRTSVVMSSDTFIKLSFVVTYARYVPVEVIGAAGRQVPVFLVIGAASQTRPEHPPYADLGHLAHCSCGGEMKSTTSHASLPPPHHKSSIS